MAVTVLPSSATLASQAQQQFSASVANATTDAVTWDIVEGASGGSITLSGLYTAPIVQSSTTFHVRATSVADNSKVGLAPVTITPPPAVTIAIAPLAPTIAADGQQQFSATVSNSTVTSVTWSVAEVGNGSINVNGLYTAPNSAGTFQVIATSTANPNVTATAVVTVLAPPPIAVSLTPSTVSPPPSAAAVHRHGQQRGPQRRRHLVDRREQRRHHLHLRSLYGPL